MQYLVRRDYPAMTAMQYITKLTPAPMDPRMMISFDFRRIPMLNPYAPKMAASTKIYPKIKKVTRNAKILAIDASSAGMRCLSMFASGPFTFVTGLLTGAGDG